MKQITLRLMSFAFLTVVVFLATSMDCGAQALSRGGRGEIFILGQQTTSDSTETGPIFQLRTYDLDLDSTFFIGLGAGYNFNDYLNLNLDVWYGSMDVTGSRAVEALDFQPFMWFALSPLTVKGDADLTGLDCNLDWNILKTPLTPVISGGIGFIASDGKFQNTDARTWNGYSAQNEDFSTSAFSYNLGLGLRWDIGEHFVAKTLYRFTRANLFEEGHYTTLDGASLSVGYVF